MLYFIGGVVFFLMGYITSKMMWHNQDPRLDPELNPAIKRYLEAWGIEDVEEEEIEYEEVTI